MLKLLLDEHLSPDVVKGLRQKCKSQSIFGLGEWENGRFLGQSDEAILQEASAQKLTLVTYDLKTIPPLLKIWTEAGREHGGIILIHPRTIPSSDRGGLIRALQKLAQETGTMDWRNRVCFLRR